MSNEETKKGWVVQQIIEDKEFIGPDESMLVDSIKEAYVYDTRKNARIAVLPGEEIVRHVQLDKNGKAVKILQ